MKKIVVAGCLSVAAVFAAANASADDWREQMRERPVALRDGVTARAYALEAPRTMKAFVVKVDLTTPGIGFAATARAAGWGETMADVTNQVCRVETKRETTADFVQRRRAEGLNVCVAFNTTPWEPFPAPKGNDFADPLGLCVAEGEMVSLADAHPAFVVRMDGTAEIVADARECALADVVFAASAFDLILSNGVDVVARNRDENEGCHPRLALGLTADRRTLVVLAVDGRQPGYSEGATMGDLRAILRGEGVTDAVNMDGGGSTSLVVWDEKNACPLMLNRHKNYRVRANAVNFGIAFASADNVREVERSASVFHSYEFEETKDTPAPEGFKPFYVSHYGRHGSRRLTGTFVADTLATLENAQKNGDLTEEGKRLLIDVRKIAEAHEDMIGQLTERGAQEHRRLARRMAARFPDVFKDARRVRCQSAIFHRVLISQANFTMALKDAAPAFTFDFITGDKYQKMLNGPHWARGTANVAEKIKAATDAYAKENIDPAPLVERIFSSTVLAGDALAFVRDLFVVASICQCLRCELAGLDIYRYFTAEEIDALGRTLACEHYADMANSVEFGDVPLDGSRKLARDFLERADEAIADDGIAADLRFGHDSGLWPLAGLIGLEGPGDRVPFADSSRDCPAWKWMPMASNLQMVFYRNAAGEVLVKVLYNEREMHIRGLEPVSWPYYCWSDLRKRFLREEKKSN